MTHYIPTHSSWLNWVERWFTEATNKGIHRESWTTVSQLKQFVAGFVRMWNDSGKKFQRVQTFEQIKERITPAKKRYAK